MSLIKIQHLQDSEIEEMYQFPLKMGWNPGLEIKKILKFYEKDETVVLSGKNEKGEIVAIISCPRHENYGWIGM